MAVRNPRTGTTPAVIHGNGLVFNASVARWFPWAWDRLFREENRQSIRLPDVTVMTCNNTDTPGAAEKSLEFLGIEHQVLGTDIPAKAWNNRIKCSLFREAAKRATTPYCMALDSFDVLVLPAIRNVVATFETFGADMVFGAEANLMPPIFERGVYELELADTTQTDTPFLNGGCWMTRTPFCVDFLTAIIEGSAFVAESTAVTTEHVKLAPISMRAELARYYHGSEQAMLRAFLPQYPSQIRLDTGSVLFQNLFGVEGPLLEDS